jgi:hypothetical protein
MQSGPRCCHDNSRGKTVGIVWSVWCCCVCAFSGDGWGHWINCWRNAFQSVVTQAQRHGWSAFDGWWWNKAEWGSIYCSFSAAVPVIDI